MQMQTGQSLSSSTMALLLFLTLSLSSVSTMANLTSQPISKRKGYIIFVETPQGQDIKDFAITTLTTILGSQQAAKESLGYIYRSTGSGFSAALSPDQADLLQKQAGVLNVIESKGYRIDPPIPGV